ncbi:right-handed parallel beta-helix repeat-containing protein [Agrilutibacter solisilvae]|uniref:Right-handed parallel beta-helix repeat-containing protein n=1 Tax=Agrilutibacter solisilvae TaxID=2763317 RepID=A0A975ATZ7_9GAMM|nr:right-handed parallel beta-helix repeat-containing protein [Lysobacter solisilvae]QSX79704.1 right-handed parallel beta-helix repeat-containing protein [Lysobacter solisilvae]
MINTRHATTLLALACLALAAPTAGAAESYDNCAGFIDSVPTTVSSQGVWCLRKDLSTAMTSGVAINITANNVTIDCNDFKLGGLGGGAGTNMRGIEAQGKLNTTVRRCNIRGFRDGISFIGGGGHLFEDNRLEANTYSGISLALVDESIVRRNIVRDTGGSTSLLASAVGISTWGTVDILDNAVSGVEPTPGTEGEASAYGIVVHDSTGASVRGNRVRGLVHAGAGVSYGIHSRDAWRVSFVDNQLVGAGTGVGISCEEGTGRARDNVIDGFADPLVACTDAGGNTLEP